MLFGKRACGTACASCTTRSRAITCTCSSKWTTPRRSRGECRGWQSALPSGSTRSSAGAPPVEPTGRASISYQVQGGARRRRDIFAQTNAESAKAPAKAQAKAQGSALRAQRRLGRQRRCLTIENREEACEPYALLKKSAAQ